MPELPEVETTLRGIEPHILNKKVSSFLVRQDSLRWVVPTKLIQNKLINKTFSKITRRGKYLLLESSNKSLIVHLGMSGSLRISSKTILIFVLPMERSSDIATLEGLVVCMDKRSRNTFFIKRLRARASWKSL